MRPTTVIEGLNERLEAAIEQSDLNLSQICEKSRITRHMLWQYRYYAITPSALVLARLAVTLNVSTDYLLGISREKRLTP